ncbi:S-adenosyl-L-methionine-dependent methyltransferase [Cercophora newfieldiana]|uniref:DNA (cytosine-5-)-methyltransferase n=1 Tax=Cercophora newfieldiana TaxID=92897 RepID=A0AA39YB61_9PEZI|nr:S-adenosyl-L-methionine-dependent methyltransferase [Cercophora newfieldiana]
MVVTLAGEPSHPSPKMSVPQSPEGLDGLGTPDTLPSQEESEPAEYSPAPFEPQRSRHVTVDIPSNLLTTPKSRHHGFTPPLPPVAERVALEALAVPNCPSSEWVEFELDQFSFYISGDRYLDEMRSLQHMSTRPGHSIFYCDGILSNGGVKQYVQGMEIVELPIGNYGRKYASVADQIWVRSRRNHKREVYYLLKNPAAEYARFFTPFQWVADLAKHVVDFTSYMIDSDRALDVRIGSFKDDFVSWLLKTHGVAHRLPVVERWLAQHPSHDFRTAVATNIEFIWKEMHGVLGSRKLASLPLIREVMSCEQYKMFPTPKPLGGMIEASTLPGQHPKKGDDPQYPTIVTSYVKECFGNMVIGEMLRVPGEDASQTCGDTTHIRNDAPQDASRNPWVLSKKFLSRDAMGRIKVGDTISTPRDERGKTNTKWQPMVSRNSVDDGRWFGLVQKVHVTKNGHRSFDVTWLYRPADTPCGIMKYPWPDELFLSDHCTCEEGARIRIKEDEILAVHPINWFGNPNDSEDRFFIRQMYMVEERRWVSLQEKHLTCCHSREIVRLKPGDTILATLQPASDVFSEPYEVVKVFRQGDKLLVRLRVLLRREKMEPLASNIPRNELVYTDNLIVAKKSGMQVLGKCHVRFFRSDEPILSPYDRGGTGNLFFIRRRLDDRGECVPLGDFPTSLRQGFDPQRQVPKLKGLDLYCGAGNFGRGLEDAGVVEMRWANDIWDKAIHTYMANSLHGEAHPFLGSVDDLLREAIEGNYSESVPRPGDVDFISAGSPCPGFSLLTQDKTTLKQIKNQSLVASFAAFVDFYRPKYGVLENVTGIVPAPKNQDENVLSQLFCALVGMGYQSQVILGDAWSHGAPQTRTRVFLYFAAPGLRLPDAPLASHSHHPDGKQRAVGSLCNAEPFVRRLFDPTAFKYVTAAEGTADLPPIHDSKPDCCVPFPDHRLAFGMTTRRQWELAAIPVHPFGMNFAKAWNEGQGVMSQGDRELFPPAPSARTKANSQGYSRQHPNKPFPTMTTRCQPTDARGGSAVHWYETRPFSIMEARRAQGFPDDEVLVGGTRDQWKLVGNSVARPVALAIGLKFREAWLGSLSDDTKEPRLGKPGTPREVMSVVRRFKQEGEDTTTASESPYPSEPGEFENGLESTPATVVSSGSEASTPRGVKRRLSEDLDREENMIRRPFKEPTSRSRSRSASTAKMSQHAIDQSPTPKTTQQPGPTVVFIDLT